jgi:hypothetical protein
MVKVMEQIMTDEKSTLLTLDQVWDNFCGQLNDARTALQSKEEELEYDSAHLTRIDLTEYNDCKTVVSKLEAAVEILDIVRVSVFGETSRINIE